MPWLIVLGDRSWWNAGQRYPSGIHEVDADVAEVARQEQSSGLIVTEVEPVIVRDELTAPLTLDHIKLGRTGHVRLPDEPEPVELEPEDTGIVYDFDCDWCPKKFPSRGALVRHVEFHHDVETARQETPTP